MNSTTMLESRSAETGREMRDASVHVSALASDDYPPLGFLPISADSHVTEAPNCYIDYIDPKYRDTAPCVVKNDKGGDAFLIDGMPGTVSVSPISSAGVDPRDVNETRSFDEIHAAGWKGEARVEAQDRDGIGAEIIYPSIGMLLCNHPDNDYRHACFQAYNRWLQAFQSHAPDRVFGLGMSAVRSVEDAVQDFRSIKAMGFKGVMMPCDPGTEFDYDDPAFDALWEVAVELQLPISFHIFTSGRSGKNAFDANSMKGRGKSWAHNHHAILRANQDVLALFLWGRIFERFPGLRIVCAEADAGWVPHFMYRMDHYYNRHRFFTKTAELPKLPSEYFSEHIYMTFQDDIVAFNTTDMMNPERLLWANDFPHLDATWPWSHQLLAKQTRRLSEEVKRRILRDNVIDLYNLPLAHAEPAPVLAGAA